MILAIFLLLLCGLQSFLVDCSSVADASYLCIRIIRLFYIILKAEFQTKIGSTSAKVAEYWINNMCEWQPF